MLLPRIPPMVTVGGELTLFCIWLIFGERCLDHHVVETWNVCLGAMVIALLGFWKGTRWDYFVIGAFGATLGFFPLMRSPAIQSPLACCFVSGVLGLVATANMSLQRKRKEKDSSFRLLPMKYPQVLRMWLLSRRRFLQVWRA
jgi:hypothetical protein